MNDESALLKAVTKSPHDDSLRLVYADWLEEQGETDRACYLRTEVLLSKMELEDVQPGSQHSLLEQLRGKLDKGWVNRAGKLYHVTLKSVAPHVLPDVMSRIQRFCWVSLANARSLCEQVPCLLKGPLPYWDAEGRRQEFVEPLHSRSEWLPGSVVVDLEIWRRRAAEPLPPRWLEEAYAVAWQRLAYDNYQSDRNACQSLKRRCPGATSEECETAFRQAAELHGLAVKLVEEKKHLLWKRWHALSTPIMRRSAGEIPIEDVVAELGRRCAGFPECVYRRAVASIFFWYHQK